jgi:hypothetical protein
MGFLALVLALSSWALYRDLNAAPAHSSGGKVVGTIIYRQRQAERKYTGQVLWGSLLQNSPVYNLDAIRTASDSSATIYLEDKTRIELGEDTLLVLDVGGAAKKLDLSGGTLSVEREGGSGSLKVATSSGDLALEKGAVAISAKKAAVSIAVAEGRASFRPASIRSASQANGASGAIELDQEKAVSVSASGDVAEAKLEPVSPASGKELVALADRTKVDFSWIGPVSFAGLLELAADPDFSRGRDARPVSGSGASLELTPGEYYWRLRGAEGKGPEPSRAFKLSVVASGSPRLIRPAAAASIANAEGAPSLVDFAWSASPKAEGYRIEVSSDPSFAKSELRLACQRASLSTDKLGQGRWYWRVAALFPSYGLEAASSASSFDIVAVARPTTAWRGDASTPLETSTLAAKAGALSLSWEQTEGADAYRVAVAKDKDFREIVYSGSSRSSATTIATSLDEGTYYARVSPIVAGKEGEASASRTIVVHAPEPIVLLAPAKGSSLPPERKTIDFSWSDPNLGRRFRVELASDPDFGKLLGRATSAAPKASIDRPEGFAGELYWRVSSLDAKDSPLATSASSSFALPALLASPVVVSPADGEVIDAYRRGSFSFAWKASSGAEKYRLSLYRLTGGAMTPVREWTTDKTSVDVKNFDFLAVDAYAWKLTALGAAAGGAASESPATISYFKITQSSQVSAPKLKAPEIIYVH